MRIIDVLYSSSLELILLVVAIAAGAFLAVAVYRNDPESATNRIYALLSTFTLLWLVNNYLTSHILRYPEYSELSLILGRFGILWAAPMSALFLLLGHTIPSRAIRMSAKTYYMILGITLLMMVLNLSSYAFTGVEFSDSGLSLTPGPGLLPFSLFSTIFSVLAVYFLVRRFRAASGDEKQQLRVVLIGILAMLALIILTVLLPIVFFSSLAFLPFTPVYVLVFLGLTAYAIAKYHLFSIKVLVTQALTVAMVIILFAKLFGEETRSAQAIDSIVLVSMVVFGYFLVRSVKKEVEQRELIEAQEKELEGANRRQENLLHFISHEVKGYLTKNQAAFAAIASGDYGTVPSQLAEMSQAALADTRKGVATVIDILDASNLKSGTVSYDKKPIDLAVVVDEVVHDLQGEAHEKGLTLTYAKPVTGAYTVLGDVDKLRHHVLRNVIDNSIKYTPSGSVAVELTRDHERVRMTVTDTGVGITTEDMPHLFTEGGHGKESIKVNVHSTGYGLFIAKQVVDAHGGKIWAESSGAGKGSRFFIELPVQT